MCWSLDARDARSACQTRQEATETLRVFTGDENTLSTAELIIGELLANAARYAGGYACLELGVIDGFVTISLHDAAAEFTLEIRRPADELAESGRGLFLVSQLARKISVIPMNGAGKCVRVVLDLRPATMGLSEPTCGRRWLRHEDGICMGPRIAKYYPEMTRRRDE